MDTGVDIGNSFAFGSVVKSHASARSGSVYGGTSGRLAPAAEHEYMQDVFPSSQLEHKNLATDADRTNQAQKNKILMQQDSRAIAPLHPPQMKKGGTSLAVSKSLSGVSAANPTAEKKQSYHRGAPDMSVLASGQKTSSLRRLPSYTESGTENNESVLAK